MNHDFDSDPIDLAGLKGSQTNGSKLEWSQFVVILAVIWAIGFVIFMLVTCAIESEPSKPYYINPYGEVEINPDYNPTPPLAP